MKGIQELLAYNDEMNSFITKGCGRITLRDYFNHDLNTELLVKGIQIYKNIQANTSDNKILDLGLANWQLENWGALFIDCFNDLCTVIDSAIKSRIEENIDTLKLDIQTEANKLEQFKIKSCYNHCDLHDNNFIYAPETNEVTLIDLGESSYSNPIFSLLGLLEHTKNRYQLSENSDEYQSLYQACFNDYEAKFTDFKHVLELVEKLSPLYFLLSMKQFIQIIGLDVFIDTPKNIKNLNHTFNSLLNNFLTI